VDDLPLAMHQAPQIREARQNRLAIIFGAGHEGVHASVEVHVRAEALHRIRRDLSLGQFQDEVLEVLASAMRTPNEFGRNRRKEGEVRRRVQRGCSVVIPCFERIVPFLEIILFNRTD
jgi:hypothetical protein